jgi:hypothetical protein
MSITVAAFEKVASLLNAPRTVDLGEGRKDYFIPGKPDCLTCKGTGYVALRTMPKFRGETRYQSGCPTCQRDPMQYLCDRVFAECVRNVLREHPELR